MTASVLLVCFLIGSVTAVVDLSCSDNATCIEGLARDLVRSLRQQKAVRLFDTVTIEPLGTRQGRSREGLWSWIENNAISFDWSDFTFKVSVPRDGRDDALDLEMYESRTAKEAVPDKKSSSKVEDEKEEDKAPKLHLRRRQKKKVFQALIPLLFGMKTAGAVIFAFSLVAALTIKAFVASKMALIVTIGMAAKKLYETYSTGVGLQNHPYLYSQYPIDFPSASSHAYSVTGVSPQFASQEMYNPTAMGAQAQHTHDILQSQDARAQQSQQAPTQLLLNSTNAEQRWDGKSVILKYLEPIISTFKNVVSPITNVLYGSMPTVRGLNSDIPTAKNVETDPVEEIKKPKEFLVPQPRFIRAQRKNFQKTRSRPKKHAELKIDLDRLKHNKDLHDYIKTKKYKYNYPNTYYYPRVKYVVHPTYFHIKPNNSRLIPYSQIHTSSSAPTTEMDLSFKDSDWRPVIVFNNTEVPQNNFKNKTKSHNELSRKAMRRQFRRKPHLKRRKRIKRDLFNSEPNHFVASETKNEGRGFFDILSLYSFFTTDPMTSLIDRANEYTKSYIKGNLKSSRKEPPYYTTVYNILIMSVDILDGLLGVGEEMHSHYIESETKTNKANKLKKKKKTKEGTKKATIVDKEIKNEKKQSDQNVDSSKNTMSNDTIPMESDITTESVNKTKQENTAKKV